MKTVQIQELKRNLSALVEEAAGGERIVITRHNRPIATLAPVPADGVRTGARFGHAHLRPAFPGRQLPSVMDIVAEDRSEDR
jgi:prevent-host-death family protein